VLCLVGRLGFQIYDFVEANRLGIVFAVPVDVVFSDRWVFKPDIFFIQQARRSIMTERNISGAPDLVIEVHGKHAEVDVRGKRLRAALRDLRLIAGSASRDPAYDDRRAGAAEGRPATVHVNIDLQPREGLLSELNVIGQTVDEAIAKLEKFLDESTVTDLRELRIVHGHGTGQLRRAVAEFLKNHPLVDKFEAAPQNQGGGGATIVYLKD